MRKILRLLWLVPALICFIYAGIVYSVGSGTFSFVIWLAFTLFFWLCFFLSKKGRWQKVPVFLRGVTYAALSVGLVIFLLCQCAILSRFADKGEPDMDYIIVLGAQMRGDGPSVVYRYRLEKAKEYLDKNPGTICVATGGQGYNEPVSEGEGGARYLASLGVSESRIMAETSSVNTVQNIQNALDMIAEKAGDTKELKIGIVTNGFHVFRGVHIAKKLTGTSVCGLAARMEPLYVPNNMVREAFGIMKDLLTGKLG